MHWVNGLSCVRIPRQPHGTIDQRALRLDLAVNHGRSRHILASGGGEAMLRPIGVGHPVLPRLYEEGIGPKLDGGGRGSVAGDHGEYPAALALARTAFAL